jgi:HSP20 family protein
MGQIAKYNTFPALRNMLDNFWNNDLMNDELYKTGRMMPSVNVKETEKEYQIEVAAPGMKKQDFNIAVENGILTISADVKDEKEEKKDNYTRREFSYSSFTRSFTLPQDVDENNIQARYENGVLYLNIVKTKETKPQKRTIPLT